MVLTKVHLYLGSFALSRPKQTHIKTNCIFV